MSETYPAVVVAAASFGLRLLATDHADDVETREGTRGHKRSSQFHDILRAAIFLSHRYPPPFCISRSRAL